MGLSSGNQVNASETSHYHRAQIRNVDSTKVGVDGAGAVNAGYLQLVNDR